mgnify:CR=1 FL=1
MKIVFTRKKKNVEIPVFGASKVKLYAVGTAYSPDGYFAAVWTAGELEPVPACSPDEAELLADLTLASAADAEGGGMALTETFCAKGVTYALD